MKSEHDNPTTSAPTLSVAQWGNTQIPIDPALQQQSQQTTSGYYQPHQYQGHYQGYYQYTPAPQTTQQQQQQQQQQQPSAPVQPQAAAPAARQTAQSNAIDTADIATLNDALGSAGVDLRLSSPQGWELLRGQRGLLLYCFLNLLLIVSKLKYKGLWPTEFNLTDWETLGTGAEEESLQRSHDAYQYRYGEDRARKQTAKPNFDARFLGATMRKVATKHKVNTVPEDAVNYMALSLRARLQDLISAMIAASEHRTDTQFDRPASLYEDGSPMWSIVVRSDVAKQLAALEKAEREEEMKIRRERRERLEAAAAQASAMSQSGMGDDGAGEDGEGGGPKKKKKKDGPGVTARNMSEDARKKMSNAVASHAAGLGTKYAWMSQASAAAPAKPKPPPPVTSPATTTAPAATATSAGRWARPYVSSKSIQSQPQQREDDTRRPITMRDALFVIEKEKGHGGGRGSARGWT
ncbi:uncharacterized protein FIBRA_07744 [Fibroporia radiculosa]|uniref:Transcription initiation factor TFIID subunit 4 n=1 Tax=Fibroporia radiculosa TaxID=599839 RepID=J4GFF4_9APHY|nr:uncharacterized protein FIBRA_07744 [Fibroporia radiculosa]CCM05518.1 predicted protein [Fibroporia radiculosa]